MNTETRTSRLARGKATSARLLSLCGIATTVTLACYLAAGLVFRLFRDDFRWLVEWTPQFYAVLAVSCMAAIAVCRKWGNTGLFYSVELGLVLLMGYPLSENIVVELMLVIALVAQGGLLFDRPWHLVMPVATVGLVAASQRAGSAWAVRFNAPPPGMIACLALIPGTVLLLVVLLRRSVELFRSERSYSTRMDEAVNSLMDANIAFQQYAQAVEEESTLTERRRISREIHDSVGYTLVNLMMMMENAADMIQENGELLELLRTARQQAGEGLQETRRAVRSFRQDKPVEIVGLHAIRRLVSAFEEATRVHVLIRYSNMPMTLGTDVDKAIYRTIQEGLTNAFRHGRATEIHVDLWMDEDGVRVVVEDNGHGADAVHEGVGLTGMKERLGKLGGSLAFGNLANGFQVRAYLPTLHEGENG